MKSICWQYISLRIALAVLKWLLYLSITTWMKSYDLSLLYLWPSQMYRSQGFLQVHNGLFVLRMCLNLYETKDVCHSIQKVWWACPKMDLMMPSSEIFKVTFKMSIIIEIFWRSFYFCHVERIEWQAYFYWENRRFTDHEWYTSKYDLLLDLMSHAIKTEIHGYAYSSIIESSIIYSYTMYKYSKIECIIKSDDQNNTTKASNVLTLHFSLVVCYRVLGTWKILLTCLLLMRLDVKTRFVVVADDAWKHILVSKREQKEILFCHA